MRRQKRVTVTEKVKRYRIDKRRPKRLEVETHADYGGFLESTKVTFPEETIITKTIIPKETNPDLFWLWKYPIRIVIYLDTEKGFVYDERKNYLGAFEIHDLKKLYSRIGLFFLSKKKQKG
jgi:hypothetical protein